MAKGLRGLKLKTRMTLILGLIALLQTGFVGVFALNYLSESLEEQVAERALNVAKTIAAMPEIIEAVERGDTGYLQPVSLKLAETTNARFVVIGDRLGIRLAHPTPTRIGKPMHDDEGDFNEPALLEGRPYVRKATGSLGASIRGKAPIFDQKEETVVGIVSVGFMLDTVDTIIARYRTTLWGVIFCAFLFSILIAIWFSNHFKRAIFGLEPEQIGLLFEERNATLESIREGVISINAEGLITTFNQAAVNTLNLPNKSLLLGKPIQEVLPDSHLIEVLEDGEPQFDQEFWLGDLCLITNRLPVQQDGKIIGVVSSFRPKDELDMVSRKLTRIKQYADSLRSQTHEYSNKLHTIAGLIQIGATKEAMNLIGQETANHQALIKLLVAAVPDPILAGCLLGKYNRAHELGLTLSIDPDSHMTDIPPRIPREHLVSIIGNLLDNAFEATLKHHGAGGEISLTMTDLGNDLIFEIEDQGAGIPLTEQERIFEKGVSSKRESGHGIGLHLVYNLLTRIGGYVTIDPADQGGSRFTVYIPKHAPSNESAKTMGESS
ncbi:sensor histidine kinase [Marinomonas piezotolerans]|uniref:histidine kinase n=1 Tax=Marinomonas piezotolerans TaxID=2213058 RepID=A0A370UBD9_9GAMM|nr:sensor histidine kinase [Marinomonas piezotolerans]RDL45069.1 sensor histidine kinase [Marinomonas piezotolerans]